MTDSSDQIDRIRAQFTRQAEAYIRMRQTTDEAALSGLVRLAGAQAEHAALDVACGPGFLTMALAGRCASASGLDATDTFLAHARAEATRRGITNISFTSGDAERLPFPEASFGVVTCRAAFHHFPRPERVLGEMKRVLAADGRILVADLVASEDPKQAEYQDRVERLCDPTHERALPASELERMFADAGLEILARPSSRLHYDVDEWISHGGPDAAAAREIHALLEASLEVDRCGLNVRRENDRLRFSHTALALVAKRRTP